MSNLLRLILAVFLIIVSVTILSCTSSQPSDTNQVTHGSQTPSESAITISETEGESSVTQDQNIILDENPWSVIGGDSQHTYLSPCLNPHS
jgi:hypothetical protein